MDNSSHEEMNEKILISYRQRRYDTSRIFFGIMFAYLAVVNVRDLVHAVQVHQGPRMIAVCAIGMLCLLSVAIAIIRIDARSIAEMVCTDQSITILTTRKRKYTIPWSHITTLRWKPFFQYAVLDVRGGMSFYLQSYEEEREDSDSVETWINRFVPILREHSNARIIGFNKQLSNDALTEHDNEDILLEWQMPAAQQFWCAIAYSLYAVVWAPFFLALLLLQGETSLVRIAALLIAGLLAQILARLMVYPFTRASAQFWATEAGLFMGREFKDPFCTPWSDIEYLKRTRSGRVSVKLRGRYGAKVYLRVPDEVLNRLITLLREHSTARIEGFDNGS